MAIQDVAAAMQRVEAVFRRRPEAGLHDDTPATARWEGGTRVVSSHANGACAVSDMPVELGGTGDHVTPGWLFRAGLASCLVTRIAMGAAAAGIDLTVLEVVAASRSDARGILGMVEASGEPVRAGPQDVRLLVRIAAPGVARERLRALVDESNRCSPVSAAVRNAIPTDVSVDVVAA
jgi:uncharacterized OsmC-like protein